MDTTALASRKAAHDLFMQGVTLKEIATELNLNALTLKTWVRRYGWGRQPKPPLALPEAIDAEPVAKRFHELTINECERILVTLKDKPLADVRACKDAASAVNGAYAAARKALNLDGDGGSHHVHLHLAMREAKHILAPLAPVIDVPTPDTQPDAGAGAGPDPDAGA